MAPDNTGQPDPKAAPNLRQRRPSTTSVAGTVVSTAKQVEAKIESALLILWDDLPHWRRDNHFILSGYRADSKSYWKSFKSLFYVHNEFVNVWTHLVGAVVFPAIGIWLYNVIAPRYASATSMDILVFSCFFVGAMFCLGMSATFHLLCNHSPEVARWGNKLDYSGIVFLIVGSYVPALYYGLFCLPNMLTIYMYGIFGLGFACGVVSWVERFRAPSWRPYRSMIFTGLGVSGVLPICQAATIYGYHELERRMGLNWVLLQGFFYIFGAFLYAVRWPERSAPGSFDLWGNSHQIFHVLILLAASSHLIGMVKAFDYHHNVLGAQC